MNNWLEQLVQDLPRYPDIMLLTVLSADGSVPRHPGSKMLVAGTMQRGTIGGGNLEYSAIGIARARLVAGSRAPMRKIFLLGPSLGQCCGGRVEVLFEYIQRDNLPRHLLQGAGVKRAISNVEATHFESVDIPVTAGNRDNNIVIVNRSGDCVYLTEPVQRTLPEVWVFGAGHVGRAVVAQLSLLPCRVYWLDERNEIFPDDVPALVNVCASVSVIDEVAEAPDNAFYIVMTHSHALDFELCLSILQRSPVYLGLIGSRTKRATFEKRLLHRGISSDRLAQLVCPIGSGELPSNEPHAIAISLAMQLLTYWHANDSPCVGDI